MTLSSPSAIADTQTSTPTPPTLTVCALASGSRGNSTYISDGTTSILIDAGLSGIEIQRRLESKDICPKGLDAILVSHEHRDHISSVGILSRRFKIPVYISPQTQKAAPHLKTPYKTIPFECGNTFKIKDLTIHPFSISHDADDPAGFSLKRDNIKIGIATDLGLATTMVKEHLKHCSLLILEANHDPEMLENGPYPWPLKQRVKSRIGHLSNQDSGKLIAELMHDNLNHVILAHLSETNNTPAKALAEIGCVLNTKRTTLSVAMQDQCGDFICIDR